MAKRNQFDRKRDRETAVSTTNEKAHTALSAILEDAIGKRDSDRIVEVSKLLAAFKKISPDEESDRATRRAYQDRVVSLMSTEERASYANSAVEMRELLIRRNVILTRAAITRGIVPLFSSEYSTETRERIVRLASEEVAR